jgi:hypothetical protein
MISFCFVWTIIYSISVGSGLSYPRHDDAMCAGKRSLFGKKSAKVLIPEDLAP